MAGKKYGLDLGTMNMQIYQSGQGLVINEKTMIAIQRKKDMVAFGNEAYDMFERAPESIHISGPIKDGVIADIKNMSQLTQSLLRKCGCTPGFIRNNSFYLAVPNDITEVEKRAYYDLIAHSAFNTSHIYIVEKPIAAAIGEHLPIRRNMGMMLVDMGAGTTEISVISMGGITVSRLIRSGGNTINQMIIRLIRERCHLIVGFKTAEYVKLELASAIPKNNREIQVHGRDLITGLPGSAGIPQRLVFDAMKGYLLEVIDTIREMIQKIPPEMMRDILANGIYFTGGTTLIPALDKIMSSALQVKIMFSQKPAESTIRGLGNIMDNPAEYKNMVFSLKSATLQ